MRTQADYYIFIFNQHSKYLKDKIFFRDVVMNGKERIIKGFELLYLSIDGKIMFLGVIEFILRCREQVSA